MSLHDSTGVKPDDQIKQIIIMAQLRTAANYKT
jgi:hypothetical protein